MRDVFPLAGGIGNLAGGRGGKEPPETERGNPFCNNLSGTTPYLLCNKTPDREHQGWGWQSCLPFEVVAALKRGNASRYLSSVPGGSRGAAAGKLLSLWSLGYNDAPSGPASPHFVTSDASPWALHRFLWSHIHRTSPLHSRGRWGAHRMERVCSQLTME